jgi:hypothetical protein
MSSNPFGNNNSKDLDNPIFPCGEFLARIKYPETEAT